MGPVGDFLDPKFDSYFSKGLVQPPTSCIFFCFFRDVCEKNGCLFFFLMLDCRFLVVSCGCWMLDVGCWWILETRQPRKLVFHAVRCEKWKSSDPLEKPEKTLRFYDSDPLL